MNKPVATYRENPYISGMVAHHPNMMCSSPENWPETPEQARKAQEQLKHRVRLHDETGPVRHIAGIDVHYAPHDELVWAACVLLCAETRSVLESVMACASLTFPYVPGYLSFREAPAMLNALDCLSIRPDLLFVDGHGIAHPRRFGIAAHLGVLTDLPTLGVAKKRLCGQYTAPNQEIGSTRNLIYQDEIVGQVVRTRDHVKPVFVSPGHKISVNTATQWVLRCRSRFKLPEPTRLADQLSRCHP